MHILTKLVMGQYLMTSKVLWQLLMTKETFHKNFKLTSDDYISMWQIDKKLTAFYSEIKLENYLTEIIVYKYLVHL